MSSPVLSVIVTIVDGGKALERCLEALQHQDNPPRLEIIVPYDDSVTQVSSLVQRYPTMLFLPMGTVLTAHAVLSAAGQHELFDRRRAAGLAAATGPLIAMLEDRGVPRPDWARQAVDMHARLAYDVIGGAIENGRDRLLNWAVYFCDFARYQLPLAAGPRTYISDINVCYKRQALEQTRELWQERYHETTVHWALARAGKTLFLCPEFVVDQVRDHLAVPTLLTERVGWGRLFAYTRARELGARRFMLAALTPVLPLVLFLRLTYQQVPTSRHRWVFVRSAPLIALLLVAWALGEMIGYLTGRP